MLHRYLNIIQRWLWLLILATVVAGVTTYWVRQDAPTIYEANARLIIGPGIDSADPDLNALRAGARLMQTYAELPTTRPFLQEVIVGYGLNMTPEYLTELVDIRTNEETQILTIQVRDEDPARAGTIANAIADTLVRKSPSNPNSVETQITGQIDKQVSSAQEDITRMETTIRELSDQFQASADIEVQQAILDMISGERQRLSDANDTLAALLNSLRATTTNRVTIIEPASNSVIVPSQLGLTVGISAITGLILGLLIVLTFEFLQDLIRTKKELEDVTGVPILGEIVKYPVATTKGQNRLIVHTQPSTAAAECYRALATRFLLSTLATEERTAARYVNNAEGGDATSHTNNAAGSAAGKYTNGYEYKAISGRMNGVENGTAVGYLHTPSKTAAQSRIVENAAAADAVADQGRLSPTPSYMITSMAEGQNIAEIAANLAIILAESGKRVALIDADFERPELDTMFGISTQPTLMELLASKPEMVSLKALDWCPGLFLVPSGYAVLPSFSLLASANMEALLAELDQRVDVILVIAPPIASSADCLLLASRLQHVILSLQQVNLKRAQVREVVTNLRAAGAHIFGTILSEGSTANEQPMPAQKQKVAQPTTPQTTPQTTPTTPIQPETRRRSHALRRIRVIKQEAELKPPGKISSDSHN